MLKTLVKVFSNVGSSRNACMEDEPVDGKHFDTIVRSFSSPASRRRALTAFGMSALALLGTPRKIGAEDKCKKDAFAIFYALPDIAQLGACIELAQTSEALKESERKDARGYWTCGMSGWETSPAAPPEYWSNDPDDDMRIIVMNYGSLDKFIKFLAAAAHKMIDVNTPDGHSCVFMDAIAGDLSTVPNAGVDPWPPA
jgi:hypothetical protein